ncbi:acetyl-CoA biotin carboxyl carrier [Ignicoccus islandicus DSM 13165]|uniref:Large ribosomal subunit protein uL10 n=1 Tax=Ignicoccus islandicus DSM 13165 TaxID=940295 RepID=A0A0U2VC25_9CREN|nr:50S ribosomal protein L10 [Ignicoccus islandicus]ALU11650.1 acetyl-CoA biotin carboxyl carrier [Ignicoccus islandicus DSM 13165]
MSAVESFTRAQVRERYPEWKVRMLNEVAEQLSKHDVFLVVDLTKTPANVVHKFRKKYRKELEYIRTLKNNIVRKAFEKSNIELPKEMDEALTGTNLFIATDENPFLVALKISKFSVPGYPKPGDIAETEIVIPAMDTGLKPGPMLSTFGKLKIKTMVKGGTIHIAKDTVVAKPGDVISPELVSVLMTLGITPVEIKLKLKGAYIKSLGRWVPASELLLDIESYKKELMEAYLNALKLGAEIAYPVPEVLELSLTKAMQNALKLAVESAWLTKESAPYLMSKAQAQAYALASQLGDLAKELGIEISNIQATQPVSTTQEKEEQKEEEEEEKKEVSEEDLSAGLGALFG